MLSTANQKKLVGWLLAFFGAGLLTVIGYSAKTSWQSERRIDDLVSDQDRQILQLTERSDAQLRAIDQNIRGIKRAFISMLLEKAPDKATIARDLVSSESVNGIDSFNKGSISEAFTTWSNSAAAGDSDSALAIFMATGSLQEQLQDPSLPPDKRSTIEAALRDAPKVTERDGTFFLKGSR